MRGGGGIKACADNANAGGWVQNLETLADVILEHSLRTIKNGDGLFVVWEVFIGVKVSQFS